jgi:spore germination cell wall hydrolase CwlJ-like protein
MSLRLKAAIAAAFTLSATAAVTAADMSSASEAAPSVVSLPGNQELNSAPAAAKPAVVFAAPREVAQPLPPLSDNADVRADNLSALVDAQGAAETLDGDMKCLAGAVYFESKGESLEGQLAVARVIINRAKSGRFASSLCGVVYQPGQFSFVRGRGMPTIPMASESWRQAVAIAQIAMQDSWNSKAEGALFFHARRVSPGWGKRQLAAIDNHIFYR